MAFSFYDPRAHNTLQPAGFGRDLSLLACAFALSPCFTQVLPGKVARLGEAEEVVLPSPSLRGGRPKA